MPMVDFDFYTNTYLGSRIPEKAFDPAAAQAARALERMKRIWRVTGGAESEAMAICAMAETVYEMSGRKPGVTAATVGGVSVRYGDGDATREKNRALLDSARIFLDIYRGVKE